jgi:small subunit ribosomal protein S3
MVSSKEFAGALLEDIKIRGTSSEARTRGSDILIRKDKQRITIDIYTARPGIVIGKSGVGSTRSARKCALTHKNVHQHQRDQRPELDAKLVARRSRAAPEPRVVPPRDDARLPRRSAQRRRHQGAVLRPQWLGDEAARDGTPGRVPLHTIRADIDYGFTRRGLTGRIGVKVDQQGRDHARGLRRRPGGKDVGDQDTARRRGGVSEGLGASREAGRGRGQDREGLGPVRRGRPGQRGGRPGGPRRDREQQAPEAVDQVVADAPVEDVPVENVTVEGATPVEQTAPRPRGRGGPRPRKAAPAPAAVCTAPGAPASRRRKRDST